jgi:hypothetical protein
MRGGDYVYNPKTGETRLVIAYDAHAKTVTFSGNLKWVSAKDWLQHVRIGET